MDIQFNMKTSFFALVLALVLGIHNAVAGTLYYELLPDSTITPILNGGTGTGPSQPLTGSFAWTPVIPSGIVDSKEFSITALKFRSPSYFLTLDNSPQPDNITKNGPDGQTALNAYVNWQNAAQNPYFIGGFNQGTYLGPASAPTRLMLTEGIGPSTGGAWQAYLYIDARLVPRPSPVVLSTVASFDGTNGSVSEARLVRGRNGSYYGTTMVGGSNGLGNIFKVTTAGKLTSLLSFNGTNGSSPQAGLILGKNGNFYGTTTGGGEDNAGTVFKMTPNGTLTTLVSFNYANGSNPAGLIQARDGNFYGTTYYGGAENCGTVFKLTNRGQLTTLASFYGTNGCHPQAALVQGVDGNFYGTTVYGGADFNGDSFSGWGTVFKMKPNGPIMTLASFNGTNGAQPLAALTPTASGELYGITGSGGLDFSGTPYTGNGTVFKIGAKGRLTTLHFFAGYPDEGSAPQFAPLVQGQDGSFYGTTFSGGEFGGGTIFKLSPKGSFATLVSFDVTNGISPWAGLTPGSPVNFYGTTSAGGDFGHGTIFRLTVLPNSNTNTGGIKGKQPK